MKVGIVGSEAEKFTPDGERKAKALIRELLTRDGVTEVVSGKCHLGGVDIWAADIGHELGLIVTEYPAKNKSWEGGYKPRNIKIARRCDEANCITVSRLPEAFTGPRWTLCYHCNTHTHCKSGGCWTVKHAISLGKRGMVHVIDQTEEVTP